MDGLTVLFESRVGVPRRLERAGGALENPYVYHDVAQHLKQLAGKGWLDVDEVECGEHGGEWLVDHITFTRRR